MDTDSPSLPPGFVASLSLGPAYGGAMAGNPPGEISFVRELVVEDLANLVGPKGSAPVPMKQLRETHHMLARLIAEGRNGVQCSAVTGYSPSRINILRHDPAFQELVAFYKADVRTQYIDVHARLATLGTIAAEELQERILDAPETFKHRELLEVMASCMAHVGPAAKVPATQGGNTQAVNLNIQFVEPTSRPEVTIDLQAKDVA